MSLLDGLRLYVEPHVGKHRFHLGEGATQAFFPLRAIYILEYGDELRAETIAPRSAVISLDASSFIKRGRMGREVLANHLEQCAAVSEAIPIRRLIRTRSLSALPEMARFLEEDLAAHD
jgi:hypothetical protein